MPMKTKAMAAKTRRMTMSPEIFHLAKA